MEKMFTNFIGVLSKKGIITHLKEECTDSAEGSIGNKNLEVLAFSRNDEHIEIDYIFKHCTGPYGEFISNICENTKIRHIDVSNASSNKFVSDLSIIYNEWLSTFEQSITIRINANVEPSRQPKPSPIFRV